jgi:hypothetical protein
MDIETQPRDAAENIDARAERIMGLLGGDDDDGAPPETVAQEESTPAGEDAAPPDTDPGASGEDEGQREPEKSSAIEAPLSWSAEGKAAFAKLPPDLQQIVATRESERERGVSQRMSEAAEKAKAAEAEKAQAAQERQRYAQQLSQFANLSMMIDPVLAEGQKTDWAKLAREEPATYVQKWAEYQQRFGQVQAAIAQRDHIAAQELQDKRREEATKLLARVPEWGDAKKYQADFTAMLTDAKDAYGFAPEEIDGLVDHRAYLVLRDAMRYRQQEAAKKAAIAKQVAAPTRVQKPGGGESGTSQSAQLTALRNRANRSGRMEDRAAYVLAKLEQGN